MPITVRVRNFQSIEDATVVIDGFTVVTGPNNSGKTAFLRAIRGVFTNAPPGPLVRHGAAHLSVHITFDDGQTVLWEKGWEKPDQKGGTVNRYFVNGKELSKVGRGCPPEVEALGVRSIPAGTQTVWPQIADQFSGVLFLVGSPGSAVAEAIADVDRVGKLSNALKLAESDKRSTTSTLKVRRKDQETLEEELQAFAGLDTVAGQVKDIETFLAALDAKIIEIETLDALRTRLGEATKDVERLAGVGDIQIPTSAEATAVTTARADLHAMESLRDTYMARQRAVEALEGVAQVESPPDGSEAQEARQELRALRSLGSRKAAAEAVLAALAGAGDIEVPPASAGDMAKKAREAIAFFRGLQNRRDKALAEIEALETSVTTLNAEHEATSTEVGVLLAELGVCPTCRQSMGEHQHGETA